MTLILRPFAVLIVTILLFITFELYQIRKSCSRKYAVSTAREDEHLLKKRLPLSGKDLLRQFNNVKTFVMFIGYPRSGHSLIGSLLDAHPEIVIPHEYDIVANWKWLTYSDTAFSKNVTKYRLFYDLYSLSEKQALFRLRSPKRSPRSYCYHVPGTWQGTYHKTIKVIGDKKGGGTSKTHPSNLLSFFTELEKVVGIPLKLIHIVRNPFDNIATIALREAHMRNIASKTTSKMNNSAILEWAIKYYFLRATTNRELLARRGNIILNLKSHETIQRPHETIQKLCNHVMVTCYPEFVEACVNILFEKVSVTRNSVVWTDNQKERVLREMQNYSFFQDFNFEDVA